MKNRFPQLFWLSLLLLCSACSSGPKPWMLPDGFARTEINPSLDISTAPPSLEQDPSITSDGKNSGLTSIGPKVAALPPVIEVTIVAPEQVWQLQKGETIRSELTKWAKDSDWSLVWQLDKDWVIPSNSQFSGGFDVAAAKVVETLSSNGVLIHANFYSSNKTLVITGPGVTPQ